MAVSVAIALVGIALAVSFYAGRSRSRCPRGRGRRPRLYRGVRNKYFVDEAYEAVFVSGLIKSGGRLLWEIDARVVDGSRTDEPPDRRALPRLGLVRQDVRRRRRQRRRHALQAAWRGNRRLQNGQTQNYALAMAGGVFGLVCLYLFLR